MGKFKVGEYVQIKKKHIKYFEYLLKTDTKLYRWIQRFEGVSFGGVFKITQLHQNHLFVIPFGKNSNSDLGLPMFRYQIKKLSKTAKVLYGIN